MQRNHVTAVTLAMALFLGAPAHADDVTDQMDEALKAYEKGDYNTAITALDAASTLIRQKKAETVTRLLPEAPAGWEADEATSSVAGSGMFGGGINAERAYRRKVEDRSEQVKISIMTDSPLLQTMSMMFSNPMFMGQENKLVVVGGQKAIANERDKSLTAMIANKVLVKVDGQAQTTLDDLKLFFKSIDFKAIEDYAQ